MITIEKEIARGLDKALNRALGLAVLGGIVFAAISFMFWWPLLVYSFNYWFGG